MEAESNADFTPGSFACHEACHMAFVLMQMVEDHLCEHPAVALNPDWMPMAQAAHKQLYDLYQTIAASHSSVMYQRRAANYYVNDRFDEALCSNAACGKPYRGPAIYCSLECAEADA